MKFVKEIDQELAFAIKLYKTTILRLEIVEFYHSHGKFHMIYNTYGWKSKIADDGSVSAYKTGWWSHFAINADGSPSIHESSSLLIPIMLAVFNKHRSHIADVHWYKGDVEVFS